MTCNVTLQKKKKKHFGGTAVLLRSAH